MGYLKNVYEFDTYKSENSIDHTHIFSLNKKTASTSIVATPSEQTSPSLPNYTASTSTNGESIVSSSTPSENSSPTKRFRPAVSASASVSVVTSPTNTKTSEIQYKVQVIAVSKHDINHPRYRLSLIHI